MDPEIVRWIITGIMGVLLWFGKRTLDTNERRIEFLEKENQDIKLTYIHKNDFKEFKAELKGQFEELKTAIRESKFHAS